MSLVDPEYELIDPCPDLHASFLEFNGLYFQGTLASCEVVWSKRMTKCAGLCQYHPRSGYCSIRLSEPLLKLRPRKDFIETLLHEMIHAYLFLTSRIMDRDGHGPQFQFHMHRINTIAGTNITIYHSFHAEVRLYQQHWWRCDGKCRNMRPFFGWVKRAMNRAPGKNDFWWSNHQRICGGNFIKVKEPEKVEKKTRKRKSDDKSNAVDDKSKITSYFPGKGYVLDSGDTKENITDVTDKKPSKIPKKATKTPKKKTPPKSKRFPGTGHRLGGSETSSKLITDFMVKTEPPSEDIPGSSTSNGFPNNVLKTPDNAQKPDLSKIKSPELVQLEHDDFGWDDEEIIVLDEIEVINKESDELSSEDSIIIQRIGNSVYIDEQDLTFDDMVAINEQNLQIKPFNDIAKVKNERMNNEELEIIMEKVQTKEVKIVGEVIKSQEIEEMANCPICTVRIPLRQINAHLDICIV